MKYERYLDGRKTYVEVKDFSFDGRLLVTAFSEKTTDDKDFQIVQTYLDRDQATALMGQIQDFLDTTRPVRRGS